MQQTTLISNIIDKISDDIQAYEINNIDNLTSNIIEVILGSNLDYEKYTLDIAEIVGKENIKKFESDTKNTFWYLLESVVSPCIKVINANRVVNKEALFQRINSLCDSMMAGYLPYTIRYRLLNISIHSKYVIDDSEKCQIYLRPISESEIYTNYPLNDMVNELCKPHWNNHNAELVFELKGVSKDIEFHKSVEGADDLVKSIINSLSMSGLLGDKNVYSSHKILSTPFDKERTTFGFNGYDFYPKSLGEHDFKKVSHTYKILRSSKEDIVLQTAIDRFLIAKHQDLHHPNKISNPNWDKLVDYVIAFETLFVSSGNGELSYRFKLNGTSILSKNGQDKRLLFDALGYLYGIRSKIVHGSSQKVILKEVTNFMNTVNMSTENTESSIECLSLVTEQLEKWILFVLEEMYKLDKEHRPYNRKGGWEDLLWK